MSDHILNLLLVERTKLDAAIRALQGSRAPAEFDYDSPNVPDWVKPAINKAAPARKKRTMSAAARKRIGEATRARWAAKRATKAEAVAPKVSKKLGEALAPKPDEIAFKKRMSEVMKKAWKKRKAAEKK
ncbi:MAG: hypothetical protein ABSF12_04035 [Bryobacteraceae bacterium]|jgi:hypothetical protein